MEEGQRDKINAKTSLCPREEDMNSICPWPAGSALLMSRSPAFKPALPEEGKGAKQKCGGGGWGRVLAPG